MARKAKPLILHVLEDTFWPNRHAALIQREPLPLACPVQDAGPDAREVWDELRALQIAYCQAPAPKKRAALATQFGGAIKRFHAGILSGDLPMRARQYAAIGPSGRDALLMHAPSNLWRRWSEWETDYGYRWRVQNSCQTPSDEFLRTHGHDVDLDEDVPDPPGWQEFCALI